jgi:predicted PurR-regulated permease PerM
MNDDYLKKIMTIALIVILVILSFFILRPVLLSIIFGLILAFVFTPLYNWLKKITKSKSLSSLICCILLILVIFLPLFFLTPTIIQESFKVYVQSQKIDFVTPIKNIFPSLFTSEEISAEIGSVISSFISKTINSMLNSLSDIILNFPTLCLQFVVVLFTLFFVLKDKEVLLDYVRSLLPFSKEIEKKLFESTAGITASVLYGQIIIGILQGFIAGIGYIVSGISGALFLTLITTLAGIFPIIGPALVWVPVAIYLFIQGNNLPALIIIIFGTASSLIDNFLRPLIVSRRTRLPPALILIGMIGGIFFFGVLGIILGPLIIAYLIIILDVYKNKKSSSILVQEPKAKK